MRSIMKAFGVVIFLSVGFLLVFGLLYRMKNTKFNASSRISIHDCIYGSAQHESLKIKDFDVNFIEHSSDECINPNFPSIHIGADIAYDAWVHIVHTDAHLFDEQQEESVFLDVGKEMYPFYALEKDFYDAPFWNSSLLFKPLSYWIGHAYAVSIDQKEKLIRYVGGISWGFKFSLFQLGPSMIFPVWLSINEWRNDIKLVSAALGDYKIVE